MKTGGYFCCRNNGRRRNPISGGSLRYAAKVGLPSHQYPTNDPMYMAVPKNPNNYFGQR